MLHNHFAILLGLDETSLSALNVTEIRWQVDSSYKTQVVDEAKPYDFSFIKFTSQGYEQSQPINGLAGAGESIGLSLDEIFINRIAESRLLVGYQ